MPLIQFSQLKLLSSLKMFYVMDSSWFHPAADLSISRGDSNGKVVLIEHLPKVKCLELGSTTVRLEKIG